MTKIHFRLKEKLHELEMLTGKRYGYTDFERVTGGRISRQSVRYLLNIKELQRIDITTLAMLLDFFHAEGLPVKIGDLFEVRE